MKVVLINSSFPPNAVAGAERVVVSLGAGLIRRGHEVVVITTQPHGHGKVASVEGMRVYYIPVSNVYRPFTSFRPGPGQKALFHLLDSFNPLMARAVGRILDEERPDVVNTHNVAGFSVAVMTAVKTRGLPLVHTLHDQYLLCLRCTMFRNERNCPRVCLDCRVCAIPRRAVVSRVDVAIGVSRFILDRHVAAGYFGSAERRVIYNAVQGGHGSRPRPCAHARPFRFGFLGQLRPTKGVHLLIEAFLSGGLDGAELWIAGEGDDEYAAELKRRTAGVGQLRWLGFVKPAEILEHIDVLVVPSIWRDTAPLVILEALSHGVPVLGADRGGIPELIPESVGWRFDPESAGLFSAALVRCARERGRLEAMGIAAHTFAEEFNMCRFVDQYLSAYNTGVAHGREP